MSQSFKIDILKNLSLTANMNWYYSETYQESFTKDYENTPGNFVRTRSATAYYNRDFRQTYNAVLNYNETFFLDHHVEVMLGMEYYNKYQRGFEAQGQGAPTDDLPDLSLTDKGEGKRTINSWHEKQRILSFFGRLNYDFKDKYLLSFVFRRDGYSSLLGDNRWGFFPGVSAGWIFGREDFIKEAIPVMSFGKLRASYGINGNASGIGAYTLQGSYGSSNSNGSFNYNGNTSYLITELPNPNLRWEKTATFEVGTDLSFFANRLNTNLTYYNRLTSDKYAALSFPTSTGFSSVTNNNGEFRNQGIEIELSGKIIDSKDWTWSASGNIAFNKNKNTFHYRTMVWKETVSMHSKYIPETEMRKKWVGGQQEDQEPGILYLYQADGIYRSYDEIPANLVRKYGSRTYYGPEAWNKLTAEQQNATTNFPIQPGDTKFHDVKGADADEFKVLKAQLDKQNGVDPNKQTADNTENNKTRKKSDKNMNNYRKIVVADNEEGEEKYKSDYRGRVQDKNVNIVPQPMFVLTYYEKHDDVKRQVNYYKFIETLNNQKVLPGRLIITNEEAPLTEEQATKHFASIDEQTAAIVADPNDVNKRFARSLDFYLVQDFASAIEDLNQAIIIEVISFRLFNRVFNPL